MTKSTLEPKIKILRVIARLNIGGPAIHNVLLTKHMQDLGYETVLVAGKVAPEEGDMGYLAEAEGLKPIVIQQMGRSLHPVYDSFALIHILKLLLRFRPEIIHTHTAKAGTLGRIAAIIYNKAQGARHKALGLIGRFFPGASAVEQNRLVVENKCKVVHTFHGHVLNGYFSPWKSRLFTKIERILARWTDSIVVVSEQQKAELCNDFGIGREKQYCVVPLGFDLPFLGPVSNYNAMLRERLGLSKNRIRLVGIVGRLTSIKNHRLFLEAVRFLATNYSRNNTRFVIVGDGELRSRLEMLAKEFAIADRVIFTGWIRDLRPLYANLDVLALSSNNEGTPVAVIEAMAAGVPVIATDVGGVRELISDRGFRISDLSEGEFEICERGVLVGKGDAEGFAKGLKYLLEHPEKGREMGRRGQEYASQNHSVERLVADMDRLYKSLLSDGDKKIC